MDVSVDMKTSGIELMRASIGSILGISYLA